MAVYLLGTFFVIGVAIGVNLLYAWGRRRFTNIERMKRVTAEVKAFNSEMREAMRTKNTAKLEKLNRKKKQMTEIQSKMAMEQMKPSLLFMAPLFGLWIFMNNFIFKSGIILAHSPIAILLPIIGGIPIMVPFYWWYLICSFAFSGVLTRLAGLSMD
jgi:uncharacterized membrane protein (DUF106 family)